MLKQQWLTGPARWIAAGVIGVSLLPGLLIGLGANLAAVLPLDRTVLHTLLEWTSFMTALFTMLLAAGHYLVRRDAVTLVIAAGLFWSGCLDGYHVLTSEGLAVHEAGGPHWMPLTWTVSRFFHAAILLAGLGLLLRRRTLTENAGAWPVVSAGLALGACAVLLLLLARSAEAFPIMIDADSLLVRPWDLAPLALYLLLGAVVCPWLDRVHAHHFVRALWLSVVPCAFAQIHMAFGARASFDSHDVAAHWLKIVGYLVPLAALVFDYVLTSTRLEQQTGALSREIMARRQVEAAQGRLAAILEGTPDFVALASADWKIVYVNEAGRRLLGWSDGELPTLSELHAGQLDLLQTQVLPAAARARTWRGELLFARRDGSTVPVSAVVQSHRGNDGAVEYWSYLARDVTEERASADALRTSEARIRAIFDAAIDGMITIDQQGRITEFNPAAERMLGYAAHEIRGRELADVLISADERERHRAHLAKYAARSEDSLLGRRLELPAVRRDGELFLAEMALQPIEIDGPPLFTVFLRDVTRQHRAREALRDSEALYHSLVDHLPICVLRKDREGKLTFANRAFLEFSGRALEDTLGKTDFDLYPPDLARKYQDDDRRVIETGELFDAEEQHRDPHGELRYVHVLKTPVHDAEGRLIGTQVIFWDVTDRKRAEQALQESEQRFRQLAENVREVFWITTADSSEVLYVSPAYEQVWGLPREQLQESPLTWIESIHPDDRERVRLQLLQRSVRESYEVEYRVVRPDGAIRWIRDRGFPVRNQAGEVYRMAGIAEDVTERKWAEDEIRRKNRDLETLLYVTSHDLREPLRSIDNFSSLICERYADRLDDKGRDFLMRVVRGARRLDQLLEDVLTLSRAQRTVKPDESIDAREVVADALKQLDARVQRTHAKIRVVDPLPRLQVDRRWATRAVFNLIGNALKFTRPGKPPDVEITAYQPVEGQPGKAGLVIRDRGPGISPEHSERVFQLFQRAVGREVEGTGAGLAIARQIAERHGGAVWASPRPGGGTELTITFGAA